MKTSWLGKATGGILTLILLASPPLLAGRKHGDVENIGNRKINGRVAGLFPNFVSLEREIQIGAQYAQMFEQTARLVEDPVVAEYVEMLTQVPSPGNSTED